MMSPSLLLDGDDVCLVIGSGGSKRIRTALIQVVSNLVDFGMSPVEAVQVPRLHWDGSCAQIEPGFDAATIETVEQRWPVSIP